MSKKNNVTWSIEALNDFEDYVDWYIKNASISVAHDFIENIEHSIDVITRNNYIARMADDIPELREYVVHQYPFLISYFIKNTSEVVITSFLHQKMKK